MTRLTMGFAAFLFCLSPAMANVSPRNDRPSVGKDSLPRTAKDAPPDNDKPVASAPAAEEKQEQQHFVVNDKTEVQLDGQACKFEDVPSTASIVNLEVAADKKTILKIFFQSKK